MRKPNFSTFLTDYVHRMTGSHTTSLTELAKETKKNHRLGPILVLYAVSQHRDTYLAACLQANDCNPELYDMCVYLHDKDLEQLLQDGQLPKAYQKCWDSYQVRRNEQSRDWELVAAMRTKIQELLEATDVRVYQMCRELNLSDSNVYAWLKSGKDGKISYRSAEKMINYLTSCKAEAAC